MLSQQVFLGCVYKVDVFLIFAAIDGKVSSMGRVSKKLICHPDIALGLNRM